MNIARKYQGVNIKMRSRILHTTFNSMSQNHKIDKSLLLLINNLEEITPFGIFGQCGLVKNIAGNIIVDELSLRVSDVKRHETLSVVIQFEFFWIPWLYISSPCLRSSPTCQKLNLTSPMSKTNI